MANGSGEPTISVTLNVDIIIRSVCMRSDPITDRFDRKFVFSKIIKLPAHEIRPDSVSMPLAGQKF